MSNSLPLRVYDGEKWVNIGVQSGQVLYQNEQPSSPQTGSIWIDSDDETAVLNDQDFLTLSTASATYATPTSVETQITQQAPQYTNRNLLYNGAMQVHQRGTSTTGITDISYNTADRWELALITMGTWTNTVENDAPTGSGFRKSWKVLCTTADSTPAAGDLIFARQKLEGQDVQRIAKGTSAAQQLTASFWVKSNVTGTYVAELRDVDNNRSVSAQYTISASGTWEKKEITFPSDTTGAFDNDNAESLHIDFWLGAGSNRTSGTLATSWATITEANRAVGQTNLAAATNNYWQITGVQLEVGPNATEFEFKSFGQELRECQRYYYLHATGAEGASHTIGSCAAYTSSEIQAFVSLPVTMRTKPTLIITTGTDFYRFLRNGAVDGFNSLTIDVAASGNTAVQVFNNSEISSTAGNAGNIGINNQTSARVAFSAEL